MLVDVHAHFYHDRAGRADWRERNASRLAAGERIGITWHVASILGSWGHTSPTYFPSPDDLTYGNAPAARARSRAPRPDPGLRHGQSQLPAHALAEIRARGGGRDDRLEAGGEPPSRRSAARPGVRGGARPRPAGAAPRLAAPPARVARPGGVRRRRTLPARGPASRGQLHPGPHRWRRRLAAHPARGRGRSPTCTSTSRAAAWMAACSRLPPRGRGRAPALGRGRDPLHRVGQAALPRAAPCPRRRWSWSPGGNAARIFPPGSFA